MFLSHLNVFIVFLAMCLFLIRYKNKTFSEVILMLFSIQTFLSSSLWLYFNYYNSNFSQIIDHFGIVNENVVLIYASLYVFYLNKDVNKFKRIQTILITFLISLILFFLHWLIKSKSDFIIYPENINVAYNLIFQILLDVIFLLAFAYLMMKKIQKNTNELFDGVFKKYILVGFIFYFVQDLLILSLLLLTIKNIIISEFLIGISMVMNLIVSVSILILAIHTNWLKEFHAISSLKRDFKPINTISKFELININELKNITWQTLKNNYYSKFNQLFDEIEDADSSKTEKMYAFFDYFDFSHKELSDLLNVSLRTIETNFYRMRKKLNKK